MKRVLSAIIILPITLAVFLLGNDYIVDVFVGIIALRSIYELFHAFEQKGYHPIRWIGYLSAIAIMFIHIIPEQYRIMLVTGIIAVSLLLAFTLLITKKTKSSVMDIVITCFGICYITLMLMFLSIIRGLNNGKFLIWYVFLASWLTDVFAYLTGKAVGKHHFTDISPNKTIEGCIGGTLGATILIVIYTILLNKFAGFNINVIIVTLVGILLSIIGQIGDLSASCIKRHVGIKDYSDLIPGHGGMVDRLDSVIFIAPFAYAFLMLI